MGRQGWSRRTGARRQSIVTATSKTRATVITDGPFAAGALKLLSMGLFPIPCGGENGKKPLCKWPHSARSHCRQVDKWLKHDKFRSANIGILTDLSGVTIVDCDDPELCDRIESMFGPTGLITSTPSGGRHYWYRSSERAANLRGRGLAIDIKTGRSLVIVPPSICLSGPNIGRAYAFTTGGWGCLRSLPTISERGRQMIAGDRAWSGARGTGSQAASVGTSDRFEIGARNKGLFKECLGFALGCDSQAELEANALAWNIQNCDPPLPEVEVRATARSAWKYEICGRNFARGGGFACSKGVLSRIGDPDAFFLYAHLAIVHHERRLSGESFALSARAMAQAGSIPGFSEFKIRNARARLIQCGLLSVVHQGGQFNGDASLFRFTRVDLLLSNSSPQ